MLKGKNLSSKMLHTIGFYLYNVLKMAKLQSGSWDWQAGEEGVFIKEEMQVL